MPRTAEHGAAFVLVAGSYVIMIPAALKHSFACSIKWLLFRTAADSRTRFERKQMFVRYACAAACSMAVARASLDFIILLLFATA